MSDDTAYCNGGYYRLLYLVTSNVNVHNGKYASDTGRQINSDVTERLRWYVSLTRNVPMNTNKKPTGRPPRAIGFLPNRFMMKQASARRPKCC